MKIRVVFAWLATLALSAGAQAQVIDSRVDLPVRRSADLINDVDRARVAMHPATPFIETSTIAIADVDLEQIDPQATLQWLLPRVGEDNEAALQAATQFTADLLQTVRGAGASQLFVTASTRSISDGGLLLIVPCETPEAIKPLFMRLIEAAPESMPQTVRIANKTLLVGSEHVIDRVTQPEFDPALRPDLILPLGNADRADHLLVVSLPWEARTELNAFWPDEMPTGSPIEFSPRALIQEVLILIASVDLPPQPTVRLRLQTGAPRAAARVKPVVEQILSLIPEQTRQPLEVKLENAAVELEISGDRLSDLIAAVRQPLQAREDRLQRQRSLKQIGLAIHNYVAARGHLPPRQRTNTEQQSLHSWRAELLPYLEQIALHQSADFEQPWNAEANQTFRKTPLPIFSNDQLPPTKTRFRAPVYPGSMWDAQDEPFQFRDIRDGTSATIAIIDAPAAAAVDWADPQPWKLSAEDPAADVFGDRDQVTVLFLDGAVRTFTRDELTNAKLKAMLTIDGGETIAD